MYGDMDFGGRNILPVLETVVKILESGADRNYKVEIKSILEEKKKWFQQRKWLINLSKNIKLFSKIQKNILSRFSS